MAGWSDSRYGSPGAGLNQRVKKENRPGGALAPHGAPSRGTRTKFYKTHVYAYATCRGDGAADALSAGTEGDRPVSALSLRLGLGPAPGNDTASATRDHPDRPTLAYRESLVSTAARYPYSEE